MIELLESTAFGAALVFGFRHGFDWDHIAALTDLTGSQTSTRRSMGLATLYALGHAAMVLVLGCIAILFAEQVPESVDLVMERLVGVSLVALGIWMAWTAVRTRAAPPLRSRWMLLIDAGAARGGGSPRRHRRHRALASPRPRPPARARPPGELIAGGPEAGPAPTTVAVRHAHCHRHVAIGAS